MSKRAVTLVLVLAVWTVGAHAAGTPAEQAAPAFDERQALEALGRRIAGKENEPAGKVFKNVKLLSEVPAGRLLRIMEIAYSRSLGVSCDHCHVTTDWSSDENAHKRIARQMVLLTRELNEQRLPAIPELAGTKPTVNCTTCHRGQTKPALSLEPPAAQPTPKATPGS